MAEEQIGKVSHYFGKINVAAIELTHGALAVGDTIHIKGHTTDLTLMVESMQVSNMNVQQAKAGDQIGIKVSDRVRRGDRVYLVKP